MASTLHQMAAKLRGLESSLDLSTLRLEIRAGADGREVIIGGNEMGLVYFARLIIDVADRGFAGAHQHVDEHNGADPCEVPIIVGFLPNADA
jgi:hypothetical protein